MPIPFIGRSRLMAAVRASSNHDNILHSFNAPSAKELYSMNFRCSHGTRASKHYSGLQQQMIRMFSEEAAATKASTETSSSDPEVATKELTFSTPRVKELYERMTKLEKEEVSIVGELILENLGLQIEPDEFYYHGIGKGGSGKGGAGGAPGESDVAAEVAPKKDTFDVRLAGFDEKSKIKVIKEVRAITGLGLKEAKEMVEGAPKVIQKDMKEEAAEELKKKLEEAGATIELV